MSGLLLALASFAACTAGGLWATRALGARQHAEQPVPEPARERDDPWIARSGASIAGTHVWAGQTTGGALRTPRTVRRSSSGHRRRGRRGR
jgi:hypothetical protein